MVSDNFKTNFNFGTNIFLLLVLVFGSIAWADTNGVWTSAEDIRAGIFGGDEGGGDFVFNTTVHLNDSTYYQGEELNNLFVNADGDTINGDLNVIGNLLMNSQPVATQSYVTSAVSGSGVWSVNGGDVYRSSGKVGVGINAPITAIHVQSTFPGGGMAAVGAGTNSPALILTEHPTLFGSTGNVLSEYGQIGLALSNGHFMGSATVGDFIIRAQDSPTNDIILGFGDNKDAVWIKNNENVGIGTNNPTQKLDVNGKIRMRTQTTSGDSADTVATKGYVDSVAGGSIIEARTSDPASPAVGRMWIRTDIP